MKLGRRETVIIAVALGVLLVATGISWWRTQAQTPVVIASPRGTEGQGGTPVVTPSPATAAKPEQVIVHISGAVRQPGLYAAPLGARLHDGVLLAGGALAEADLDAVNLATPLVDGQKYLIPVKGQQSTTAPSEGSGAGSGKININTADQKTLERLPGIGEVRAKAIIDYRQKNGPFRSIEDLKKISGIGDKTFEQMRDQVTVY